MGHLVLHVALLDSNSHPPLDGICRSLMRPFKDLEAAIHLGMLPGYPFSEGDISRVPMAALVLGSPGEHVRFSMLHSASDDCFSALWLFLNCILFSIVASHRVL